MAQKNKSDIDAAEAAREAIRTRPRQSPVRFAELFLIVRETEPERVDELFGSQVAALEEAVATGKVSNPVQKAVEKAAQSQHDLAIAALTNTDPLNGYDGYVFDRAKFDEKTREKKERVKKSKAEKVEEIITADDLTDEEFARIQALFEARGRKLPVAGA